MNLSNISQEKIHHLKLLIPLTHHVGCLNQMGNSQLEVHGSISDEKREKEDIFKIYLGKKVTFQDVTFCMEGLEIQNSSG